MLTAGGAQGERRYAAGFGRRRWILRARQRVDAVFLLLLTT